MRRLNAGILLLSLCVGIAGALLLTRSPALAQRGDDRPVPKAEYKVVVAQDDALQMEKAINALADEGWDCVGTISPSFNESGLPDSSTPI